MSLTVPSSTPHLSVLGATAAWCVIVWMMSDVEMECLATWKMNTELYLVGRLHGAGFTRADLQYRCLVSHVHSRLRKVPCVWPAWWHSG